MKTSLIIFFGFSIVFTNLLYADIAQQSTQIESNGETVIISQSTGVKVKITIGTHEMQIGKPSDRRPETIRSNCTYSKFPCSLVDYIDIYINDKPILIPCSVFCDLADLNTAEIITEQGLK